MLDQIFKEMAEKTKEFESIAEETNEVDETVSKVGFIRDNMDEITEILENEILSGNGTAEEKKQLLKKLRSFTGSRTNIMLVGATGCGKSSTINALFSCGNEEEQCEIARVGTKADPETKDIEQYTIGNLILWDTPGLGDGTEIDEHHKAVIRELLREEDEDGNALIDLVLVIMDGSTKDLGTSYKILNEVIIPELGEETNRILIALNQADIAMKTGRHWDYEKNEPDEVLVQFLEEKTASIRERVKTDSGLEINPVYYCAGYKEECGDVVHPYNLSKLLYYIMNAVPLHKRVAVMAGVNTDSENYSHNDDDMDYNEGVKSSFFDSFDFLSDAESLLGGILTFPFALVDALLGGVISGLETFFDELFD